MKKFGKLSLLFLALSTASVGGSFYINNLQDEIQYSNLVKKSARATSDNIYINITNIMFQEDLKIKVKYTIQTKEGITIDHDFITDTMYGTELVIMQKGSSDFGGSGEVERVAFNPAELIPASTKDTSGTYVSSPISLNNGLYEPGKEYDAYILWHEYDSTGGFQNDIWFNTTPSTFTTPVSKFPSYSLKTVKEGANQALVSFNVDYDESLTIDEIGSNNVKYFFDILRVNWEDNIDDYSLTLTDVISGTTTYYQNAWLDWDEENHKFTYYILIDNLSSTEHDVTYAFTYNGSNFGTSQTVSNLDSPLKVKAGNRYENLPKISYTYTVPEDPTTLADYQKVDLNFTVDENDFWKTQYEEIASSLDPNALAQFELNPTQCMTNITVDNIVSETGEIPEGAKAYTTEKINEYGTAIAPLTIKGLEPGTTYTADATLALNDEIFDQESIYIPIEFTTLSTIQQPTVTYIGDEDLDGTTVSDWSRDVLKFNLSSEGWSFSPELIEPSELFKSGTIKFYNDGVFESEAIISETNLKKLKEGENSLDTSILKSSSDSFYLKAGSNYTFTLDLEYASKAQGLFDVDYHPTINGSFKTKEQIITPTLRFVGSDLVADDKSAMDLRFEIVDEGNELTGASGEPLTVNETFDTLKILDFKEVTDEGLIENSSIDFSDTVSSTELVLSDAGENVIRVNGLKGDSTYEFTAALTFNQTANNPNHDGWVEYDEDNQILITKRISTDKKFEAFDVQVNEIETTKDEGVPTWTSTVEVRVPNGDASTSGLYSPNADVNISYELFNYETDQVIKKDTIGETDWINDPSKNESYCVLEFKNLTASNSYKVSTTSTFNQDVMVDINDGSTVIKTGKNNGFSNDMLVADWGIKNSNDVEKYNEYSDIYVSVALQTDFASNQEFLDGYQSIQLLDKNGSVVDENSDILTSEDKPVLWLDGTYKPETTLSGYKLKIVNDDYTVDSGEEFALPDLTLPGLAEPVVTEASKSYDSNSVEASFNFSNFNNVEYAEFEIKEVATDEVVWNKIEGASTFNVDDSGDKKITISTGEGALKPKTDYSINVNTYFKDEVKDGLDSSTLVVTFTTSEKGSVKPSFELSSDYESVVANYSWDENTSDKDKLTKISAQILSPKDNYSTTFVPEQSIDINGDVSGNGSFEFLNLDSNIEYQVKFTNYFESGATTESKLTIKTDEKINTFESNFELVQASENSIEVHYSYEGLNKVQTESNSSVEKIELSLYGSDIAVGTPIKIVELEIDDLNESGNEWFILEDEELIKPGNKFTVEEKVTYSTFTGWTTNDGSGEPIYDQTSKTKSLTISYDPSIVTSSIEFANDNTLEAEIVISDVSEFSDGGELNVSLVSSAKPLTVVFNGVSREISNVSLDLIDLASYKNPSSTDDEYIYNFVFNGVSVPKGESVELIVTYGDKYCGSTATQTEDQLIDPNSLKALNRYEYSYNYYVYELSIDADESIDLNSDISFTKRNSSDIQSSEVMVIDNSLLTDEKYNYDSNNLYIKVKSSIVSSQDWRNLNFLLGRYIVVNNPTRTLIDFDMQSAYYISEFGMIPLPKEPLTFIEVVLIILLIIILILLIWMITYKQIKKHRKEYWYEYALKKANAYYYMHRKNMNMYGWNHKYNEYESLNDLSIPELKEYAKKINLPIPYGLNKKELVDTVSLLNETELMRIKEFSNYKINIPEKVREDLLHEFQNDPQESKWMKKRFRYTIDRAERMQNEDYKKTIKDHFVDLYGIFDKWFVSFTDSILILLSLKETPKKDVIEKDHEWDEHENSDDIENGIVEIEESSDDSEGVIKMINKWHKAILIKEIDYDSIPKELHYKIKAITNKNDVLDYEELFTGLGYDFDSVIDELEQVDEEDRRNYIYHLFIEDLPKKQELKHIEKAMAKFDLWNYLASTLNPEHIVEEYSKKLDNEFLEETLQDWKEEKISRLVAKREQLIREREERRAALLLKRKEDKISKEEEKELEYIVEQDETYGYKLEDISFDNINEGSFEIEDNVEFGLTDGEFGMSEIDLQGDFSEFNVAVESASTEFKDVNLTENNNDNLVEEKISKPKKVTKDSPAEEKVKEVTKTETVDVEVYKTDPKLLKKIQEKEEELNKVMAQSQEELNRARQEVDKLLEEKNREFNEINESYRNLSKEERRLFEEEKNKQKEEVEKRQEKIDELNKYIEEKEKAERELAELEDNLAKASTYDELKSMSKKELRSLCDTLTVIYGKKEPKADLIQKLMSKSEKLKRIYNMVDLEKEVLKRLDAAKNTVSKTQELVIDPFSNVDFSNVSDDLSLNVDDPFSSIDLSSGMDDLFGAGNDPFANLDVSSNMDDAFSGGNDPFANVNLSDNMDDEFGGGNDPFANIKMGASADDEFGASGDPFANMINRDSANTEFSSKEDPFASFDTKGTQVQSEENEDNEPNNNKRKRTFFKR